MKFELNASEAFKGLSKLAPIINSSTVLPILECVLFEVYENKLMMSVCDLETYAHFDMPITYMGKIEYIKEESKLIDAFCIDAKPLIHFFKLCEKENVTTIFKKEGFIMIKNGDFEAKLNPDTYENYPKQPSFTEIKNQLEFEHKYIIPILTNSLKFVSNDDLRPAMTGVYVHSAASEISSSKFKLMCVSTDAHAMYYKQIIPKSNPSSKDVTDMQIIIPAKPLRAFISLPKSDTIKISENGLHIEMISGNFRFVCRHIDARYPDYPVVIPKAESKMYLKRKQLNSYINLATPFTNKATNQIQFNVSKDSIKLIGEDVDFQTGFQCSVPVYNAEGISNFNIAFNGKFIMKALGCDKDENVCVKTDMSPTRAIIIDDCIIVMPLMLNQ